MRTIYLLLLTCGFQSLSAQGIFSISIDSSYQEYQDIDLSDNNLSFRFEADMKNIGDSLINIGWSVFDFQNCPSEWRLIVSDKYMDYILGPNYDSALDIDLMPDEESPYNITIYPKMKAGCCSISVQFYDGDNPSIIFDTSYYQLKINVVDCTITNTLEQERFGKIQIHPNPTIDFIKINTSFSFESGYIYSIEGLKLMSINANQKEIQVSDLQAGMYFIILNQSNQKKTISSFIKK